MYYCMVCDEALVLSVNKIHPKKVTLSFNQECPCCGFQLEENLNYHEFRLPHDVTVKTNPECLDPEVFYDQREPSSLVLAGRAASMLSQEFTTGIEALDKSAVVRRGQLTVLQGEWANQIVFVLGARVITSKQGSDFVFVDGGNSFDTYKLFEYCSSQGLNYESAEGKAHLSRAFTYHQLAALVNDKLPNLLVQYSVGFVCVSDITLLYADPDVRDKAEAIQIFRDSVRFLSGLSGRSNVPVIVTNLKSRDRKMDSILFEYGHVFADVERRGDSLELMPKKNPFVSTSEKIHVPMNSQDYRIIFYPR